VKKTFAVIAAVLFVLSFAASAFAIHAEIPAETQSVVGKGDVQITLGGEIRTRNWWTSNRASVSTETYQQGVFLGNGPIVTGVDYKDAAWYDQRVRLSVDVQVAPNVKGFVMLETGTAATEGQGGYLTSNADKYKWGNFNSKPNTSMGILEAYILYTGSGLFGFNSGLKIGHMPLALGEGIFFNHTQLGDDAIVFFMDPTKQLHIGLLAVKFAGDSGQPTAITALGIPYYQGTIADNTDDLDGYVALAVYKIDDKNTVGINYTYLNLSDLGFSQQNLGVHGNGSFGNFGYAAEADFQFGSVDAINADFKGYAVYLKGTYKIDALTLKAQFGYGSGNKKNDSDINAFIAYQGALQNVGGAFIYDYLVTTTSGLTYTGLQNVTFYNIGLDYAATKDLSLAANGFIFRASKALIDGQSKNGGWEIDGMLKYKIAKNLTYQADIGYFKPGSFYDDLTGADTKGLTAFRGALTLSF